jgi:hypothetical protein
MAIMSPSLLLEEVPLDKAALAALAVVKAVRTVRTAQVVVVKVVALS